MSLKIPVTPLGIDPWTVQLVAQCRNHYATPGPSRKRGGGNEELLTYSCIWNKKIAFKNNLIKILHMQQEK
jgi:hypothetical protein